MTRGRMDKSVHHVQAKHTTITNVSTQMPTLPSFFKAKSHPPQVTTYYLSNRFPDEPTGQAALEPIAYPRQIPTSSLLFSLTHPEPSQSPATAFFLDCLPDPIGFLHHSSSFIRSHLSLPASNPSPIHTSRRQVTNAMETSADWARSWRFRGFGRYKWRKDCGQSPMGWQRSSRGSRWTTRIGQRYKRVERGLYVILISNPWSHDRLTPWQYYTRWYIPSNTTQVLHLNLSPSTDITFRAITQHRDGSWNP